MSSLIEKPGDRSSTKQTSDYLFQRGDLAESQFLDIRTDINTKEVFAAIMYHRLLNEHYGCGAAKLIADLMERLLISSEREGRSEAVAVLLQPQPQDITILGGRETKSGEKGVEDKSIASLRQRFAERTAGRLFRRK